MSPDALWPALDEAGFAVMRALLAVLWQSSVLLAAAGVLTLALRRRRAGVRHAVWVAALLATPLLPLLGLGVSKLGAPQARIPVAPAYSPPPAPAAAVAPAGVQGLPAPSAPAPAVRPAPSPPSPTDYPWALAALAYGGGAAAFLGLVLAGWVHITRWVRGGRAVVDGPVWEAFEEARRLHGLCRPLPVVESADVPTPMSVGMLPPVVLLPAGWSEGLSSAELRAVAVHELAHVRRRDPLVLALVSLVRAALFFHPLVWLAARRAAALAEAACDEAVIEAGHEPVSYARMLARLAEELPRRSVAAELAAGVCLSRNAFLRRIQAILSDDPGRFRRLTRLALAGTCVGIALSVGLALALPLGERGEAEEEVAQARIGIRGRAVDDETGKPVMGFSLQKGWARPDDPTDVIWGHESLPDGLAGRFTIPPEEVPKGVQRVRVLAEGYLPEPISPEQIASFREGDELVVCLKRGRELKGRVLDHRGRPVGGADVFLAGGQPLRIEDGVLAVERPVRVGKPAVATFRGARAVTNDEGRFAVRGAGPGIRGIIVSAPSYGPWLAPLPQAAPLPAAGEETTVRLPEPARLTIRCDMEGEAPELHIRLRLKTAYMEEWRTLAECVRNVTVPNGGEATVEGLGPGLYDVARVKTVWLGERAQEVALDRRGLKPEAGDAASTDFVRKKGRHVTGEVTGLDGADVPGAFVFVRQFGASGQSSMDDLFYSTFDAVTCDADGRFRTGLIEPGSYVVVAEAYRPLGIGPEFWTDWQAADFVGTARLTVTAGGPPPEVRIEMRLPGEEPPPVRPGAHPDALPLGRIYQGALVEASFRVRSEADYREGMEVGLEAPPFIHVQQAEPGEEQHGRRRGKAYCDVFVRLDTEDAGRREGRIGVTFAGQTTVVPVSADVEPRRPGLPRVLVLPTPFERFSTDDATMFRSPTEAVAEAGIDVDYALGARSVVAHNADGRSFAEAVGDYDAVVLATDALLGKALPRLAEHAPGPELWRDYVRGGGRLVLPANYFFRGTVAAANEILEGSGLVMEDVEIPTPGGDDEHDLGREPYIVADPLTAGVERLRFFRPSPVRVTDPARAALLVRMPQDPERGFVAVSRGEGEIVVLGQSLWSFWMGRGRDNARLMMNILAAPVVRALPAAPDPVPEAGEDPGGRLEPTAAYRAAERPEEPAMTKISGRVVDDETGEPMGRLGS